MSGYVSDLFFVLLVAVLAPLAAKGASQWIRMPSIVMEMLLGMLIGPYVLQWVTPEGVVGVLGEVGLAFLIFLVAIEIDTGGTGRNVWASAAKGWGASFLLALLVTSVLYAADLIRLPPVIAAAALTTTALGVLAPVLRENREMDTPLGQLLMALGAMGEVAPMIILSLMIIPTMGSWWHMLTLSGFLVGAYGIWRIVARASAAAGEHQLMRVVSRQGAYFPLRLSLLLLGFLVLIADKAGVNIVLGAGAAGFIAGRIMRSEDGRQLRAQLDSFGYGFLVPVFFVTAGMRFDPSVFASGPLAVFQVAVLLVLLLFIRLLPLFYFRRWLPEGNWVALALYSATGLPVMVIITELALKYDLMLPERAMVLVSSGMISVLVFPLLAERSTVWFPVKLPSTSMDDSLKE